MLQRHRMLPLQSMMYHMGMCISMRGALPMLQQYNQSVVYQRACTFADKESDSACPILYLPDCKAGTGVFGGVYMQSAWSSITAAWQPHFTGHCPLPLAQSMLPAQVY